MQMIPTLTFTSLSPPPPHHHHRHFSLLSATTTISTTATSPHPAIIIGGGLAGLAAATKLHTNNTPFILLESSDGVGGRVRSDNLHGFLLDRGFQIFITGYPEARRLLDHHSLRLQPFFSGARVFFSGEFHTVADPLRHPIPSLSSLFNPIGSPLDKVRVGLTRLKLAFKPDDEIFASEEMEVIQMLLRIGFSSSIIDRFFRPFFGGIFLDMELETTSRLFEFVFKCLAVGENTLPEKGIGEIPNQLASKLPKDSIRLNSRVLSIDVKEQKGANNLVFVRLENGEVLKSEIGVILAVEEPEVEKILPSDLLVDKVNKIKKPIRSTVCLYFSMDRDKVPSLDPVLYLNGSGKGIVNNVFFVTNVAPSYGPPDKALVSISLIGLFEVVSDEDLSAQVVRELSGWFGESVVASWKHLRTYRIKFAQPNQSPPTDFMKSPRLGSGVYLCGDYLTSATFDGALVSGRRAAEALIEDRALTNPLTKTIS